MFADAENKATPIEINFEDRTHVHYRSRILEVDVQCERRRLLGLLGVLGLRLFGLGLGRVGVDPLLADLLQHRAPLGEHRVRAVDLRAHLGVERVQIGDLARRQRGHQSR